MTDNSKLIDVSILDEMKKSYIDYAMSVIVSRALPDVRDGLKPVHRRILYAMNELSFTHEKPHRKSARIVGDVLGKYHPHGDSSVYNAMVRMAQDFSTRYLLVDGHGNFGSIDGDSPAAMRYTEARMQKLAGELLKDINKDTVNTVSNFDETLQEPSVLPARYPNLLVNGTNGIAVGMATSIPPHNLVEVIDAVTHIIDNPDCTVEDLIEIVKGPDFPTGAEILGVEGFRRAYRTGRGKVLVRSKTNIEEMKNGKFRIVVTEIPYQVNKAKMIEGIADLVKNKKIDGITDLRDESNRNGIRIVIELRKDVNPNIVQNLLFKHSQLQITYSIINIALKDGQPQVFNLLDMLQSYLDHQKDVETRRVQYDLRKAEERAHLLEGYRIAIDNIDEVIQIIRSSYNDAEEKLMNRFGLSEVQAKAIVDMRLRRLQGLEREKIENEYQEILKTISSLKEILENESLLLAIIKDSLTAIRDKYGDERRTTIGFSFDDIDIEDLIEEEDVVVTLTHAGYVKRVPVKEYQEQKRGGRGKQGLQTREEDFINDIFTTSTHSYLLGFTNKGRVYRIKAYQIPEGSRTSKGTNIINLLQLNGDERITSLLPVDDFKAGYLSFCTKKGIVKRTDIESYNTSRKSGLNAIKLREDDELIAVRKTSGSDDLLIVTREGKSIRFDENDARRMGRTASGVKGITLSSSDEVVAMLKVEDDTTILIVSELGYGKRTTIEEYRVQNRGGKGIKTYNISPKTGSVIGALTVQDDDSIMIINTDGVLIRIPVSGISVTGRITSGVRVMKVQGDCKLVSIAKIAESEDEENSDVVEENSEAVTEE